MDLFKKYKKVIRYGKKETLGILTHLGSTIVVQEKLDGANASFALQNNQLVPFSRRMQLDEENDLRGFYNWTQTLNPQLINENYIYFGEWLVKHAIDYGKHMNQFYLFDLYDKTQGKYLHFNFVKQEAQRLDMNLIPVFYEGDHLTLEQLQSYVGQSKLGPTGEGIIIKNSNYTYRGNQVYTKIVSEKFSEVKKTKKTHKKTNLEMQFIDQFLTDNRIKKMLFKLVDEKILDEDYDSTEIGTILRHLNVRLYEDLLEEEKETLDDAFDHKQLRRAISKSLPLQLRKIIHNKTFGT